MILSLVFPVGSFMLSNCSQLGAFPKLSLVSLGYLCLDVLEKI